MARTLRRGYFREDKTKGIGKIRGTFRPERFDWRTTRTSRSFLRRIRIFFFGFLSSLQTTRYVETHAHAHTRTRLHAVFARSTSYASSLSFIAFVLSLSLPLSHSPRTHASIEDDFSRRLDYSIELNNTVGSKIFSRFRYRHLNTDRYAPPLPSLISRRVERHRRSVSAFSRWVSFFLFFYFYFYFFFDSKRDAR